MAEEYKYITKDEVYRQIEEVVGNKPANKLDEVLQRIKSRSIGAQRGWINGYNEEAAQKLKELDVTPPYEKEIEEVKRTSVVIDGFPEIVKRIADFVTVTFEVEW